MTQEEPDAEIDKWIELQEKRLAEVQKRQAEEVERHVEAVQRFWDNLVIKVWPEPDCANDLPQSQPTVKQKLHFLKEIMPDSSLWKDLSITYHLSAGQIDAVHSAYQKVTAQNVLHPFHQALIQKCKDLNIIR